MTESSYRHWLWLMLVIVLLAASLALAASRNLETEVDGGDSAWTKETGDLDVLKKRGYLRILVPANLAGGRYLPRRGSPVGYQQETAEDFARSLGLEPIVIPVERFSDLIPFLLDGRGDMIAANLTVTPRREKRIAFSVPLAHVREQVLGRADHDPLSGPEELAGKSIAVDPATSFWSTLESLKAKHPDIQPQPTPGARTDDLVDGVSEGRYDFTVLDSNAVEMYLGYRDDIRPVLDIAEARSIAWGLRPANDKLRTALNLYFHTHQLGQPAAEIAMDDWAEIRKRRVLRVLLRNNAVSYFLWRGELMGFEYELLKEFARRHKVRLEVIVPPNHEALLDWLVEGRADIAAGFLVPTESRKARGIAFSRRYHETAELITARADDRDLAGVDDLAGRTIVARPSSAQWERVEKLKSEGLPVDLEPAPEDMETEEIIARVASGELDLTIAPGHLVDVELTWRDDIKSVLAFPEPVSHAWAVRSGNPDLKKVIDAFLKKSYKGVFYNITYKKYFKNARTIRVHAQARHPRASSAQISPYDDLIKRYADRYGFDWRLIAAQMYRESRFDPEARSWAGALGLMQVLPRTAEQLGFKKLKRPEDGIHAGVKYLDWVRDRFDPELPALDRLWFALASYNAGLGHVYDARRLARKMGWDNTQWFDHAERAMLLLSEDKYARKAKYGYVRGQEPVSYVRAIRSRYRAYVNLTEPLLSVRDPGRHRADIERADSTETGYRREVVAGLD